MRKLVILVLSCFLSTVSVATVQSNILDITSDNIVMDRVQDIVWFNNNVRLNFEEMTLQTAQLKAKMRNISDSEKENMQIEYISIPGKLQAALSGGEGVIIADSAYYDAQRSVVIFKGNVRSEYQGRVVLTEILELFVTPSF